MRAIRTLLRLPAALMLLAMAATYAPEPADDEIGEADEAMDDAAGDEEIAGQDEERQGEQGKQAAHGARYRPARGRGQDPRDGPQGRDL